MIQMMTSRLCKRTAMRGSVLIVIGLGMIVVAGISRLPPGVRAYAKEEGKAYMTIGGRDDGT